MKPGVEVPLLRAADGAAGSDTGLEVALEFLANEPIDPSNRGTWWNPGRNGEGYMFDFLVWSRPSRSRPPLRDSRATLPN